MSYYEPTILRWTATKGRNDAVQNTSDIDGRVRFVTFILGQHSRDSFLRKMRVQLKTQKSFAKSPQGSGCTICAVNNRKKLSVVTAHTGG